MAADSFVFFLLALDAWKKLDISRNTKRMLSDARLNGKSYLFFAEKSRCTFLKHRDGETVIISLLVFY